MLVFNVIQARRPPSPRAHASRSNRELPIPLAPATNLRSEVGALGAPVGLRGTTQVWASKMRNGSKVALRAHVGVMVCAAQLLDHGQLLQLSLGSNNTIEKCNAGCAGTPPSMTQLLWSEQAALVAVVRARNHAPFQDVLAAAAGHERVQAGAVDEVAL
jgi:hypothetical protein